MQHGIESHRRAWKIRSSNQTQVMALEDSTMRTNVPLCRVDERPEVGLLDDGSAVSLGDVDGERSKILNTGLDGEAMQGLQ